MFDLGFRALIIRLPTMRFGCAAYFLGWCLSLAAAECQAGQTCQADAAIFLQKGIRTEMRVDGGAKCKYPNARDGMRCKDFVQGVFHFLGAASSGNINSKLSGVSANPQEDAAKNFVQAQIVPFVGDRVYDFSEDVEWRTGPKATWRTSVKADILPKLTARIELLQHMYAARHAWVALSGLHGEEAERQRQHLKHVYSSVPEEQVKNGYQNIISYPLVPEDDEEHVQKRLELAQLLRDALTSPSLQQLLRVANGCFLPQDHFPSQSRHLSQKSRVRPVGPLTKDSVILLSEPDGSITEKDDLKMPMMTLGTGFGDCYQGKRVHYPPPGDKGVIDGTCDFGIKKGYWGVRLPEVGFYRDAVNAGIKGIDTAFIYGTEDQIGREVPGTEFNNTNVFISTKTMTSSFRKMLGVQHGTDKLADQLRALQRDSVNVYYDHDEDHNPQEWGLLEDVVHKGHARALGVSGVEDALDIEQCVSQGACRMHVSAAQSDFGPCMPYSRRVMDMIHQNKEMFGNVTMVGHSAVLSCKGEPTVEAIAKRLGRTVAEVAIRTNLEQGIPMLVQTANPAHIRQNLAVFDFELSPSDLSQISLNLEIYKADMDLFQQ